jgi:Kdo2-lipid IVA lauroyltransferase/acyltransferase
MNAVLETFIYRAISAIFSALGFIPRPTAIRLASVIGHIWFLVDRRHRIVTIENLTHVYAHEISSREIRSLAIRIFQNLTMILFEIGWSLRVTKKDFYKFFRIVGFENLRSAYGKGKGVLALTAHIGNWELLMLSAGFLGVPMSAIYRPFDFKPLDRFFADLRKRYGAKLYPKSRAMRKILRSMRDRELVGFLMDQNTNVQSGVFVDFFGKPACTHKGMALIALGTEAPVISAFLVREDAGFRVEFGPEIPLIRTGDKDKDIIENTKQYNRVIESIILRYPEQWFWVHRRWKTKPKQISC